MAGVSEREGSEDAFVTTARQRVTATSARDGFAAARSARRAGRVPEVIALRHMRVRALITDEDMRYILAYMTE